MTSDLLSRLAEHRALLISPEYLQGLKFSATMQEM